MPSSQDARAGAVWREQSASIATRLNACRARDPERDHPPPDDQGYHPGDRGAARRCQGGGVIPCERSLTLRGARRRASQLQTPLWRAQHASSAGVAGPSPRSPGGVADAASTASAGGESGNAKEAASSIWERSRTRGRNVACESIAAVVAAPRTQERKVACESIASAASAGAACSLAWVAGPSPRRRRRRLDCPHEVATSLGAPRGGLQVGFRLYTHRRFGGRGGCAGARPTEPAVQLGTSTSASKTPRRSCFHG